MTPDETGIDEALAGLPLEQDPPADLHARVRERLHSGGLIGQGEGEGEGGGEGEGEGGRRVLGGRGGARPWRHRGWAAAAAAVLAFLVGRATAPPTPPPMDEASGPLWVLLLYEDDRFDTGGRPVAEVVALYDRWADDVRRDGALVLAEKLGTGRRVVAPTEPASADGAGPHGELTGLFVVRAADIEVASALAQSLPHAGFGGTVVVRSVDPT